MAEGGEERSAVVGMSWECCHQLTCVFPDLREWIDAWLLLFRSRLTFRASLASVTAAQSATTAGAEVLEQYGTHTHTSNTQQVREHSTEHAFMSRSRKEREN